jgi:dolichol-phosphate mannosyltransferase
MERMPFDLVDRVVIVDDGSTDGGVDTLSHPQLVSMKNAHRWNIGATIRRGIQYALQDGSTIIAIMAGNGKDDPIELPRLVDPIASGVAEFVQGSRYLDGGSYNRMPVHRKLGTRLYPLLIRLSTGFRASDVTNGFRAFRRSVVDDRRVDINQDWLDVCLEYYIYIRSLQLGRRIHEVPVSKLYPPRLHAGHYTKVRPLIDWLHVLAPYFYLLIFRTRT